MSSCVVLYVAFLLVVLYASDVVHFLGISSAGFFCSMDLGNLKYLDGCVGSFLEQLVSSLLCS